MSVFINHSNHPSANWSQERKEAALAYGGIMDMPFPELQADYSEQKINEVVQKYHSEIMAMSPAAVLCQGEFTYTYGLVRLLKEHGITVLAACSERLSREEWQGDVSRKVSYFKFVKFREY
ncbi:hypothetical protein [Selenomonas sp. KH1T6]|uniref:hypothetical protein n=1 Tax=Selenomonas sp. KH1T6 TaxID=3158784 RepID=UPI0008A72E40|nr:hypothetical protein SAMN05216583_102228 [Selenomonas ruminantium]